MYYCSAIVSFTSPFTKPRNIFHTSHYCNFTQWYISHWRSFHIFFLYAHFLLILLGNFSTVSSNTSAYCDSCFTFILLSFVFPFISCSLPNILSWHYQNMVCSTFRHLSLIYFSVILNFSSETIKLNMLLDLHSFSHL